MLRGIQIARDLAALHRDRKPNYRESMTLSPGRVIQFHNTQHRNWWEGFCRDLKAGAIRPDEFRFRDLFEALVKDGREMVESWNPQYGPDAGAPLQEAAGAVASSDFPNIGGQILFTALMQDLRPEDMKFQSLIPTQQTPFSGEKIPGIGGLGDMAEVVPENTDYPIVGVNEDYIETPATTKRGFIVPITKEALFFDRTGLLLQKARAVGESLRLNKEKRAIDCLIDENTTAHRYKWRGTTYATYQTTTPWDNVTASNALVDWTDIDNINQTFNGLVDPNTGEPVSVEFTTLIVTKALEMTANRIKNATEITIHSDGYPTSGPVTATKTGNPVSPYNVVSSALLAARLATDTDVFAGDPSKYAKYMENWGITVTQAPAGNSDDFNRDIVMKFKCSERGQYAVVEPRAMGKSTVGA
jgi:hypothetical protein